MTMAGSKIVRSETTSTIDWKVDRSPINGMNCLGRLSRDSGQTRVPEPPHMITGWILLIDSLRICPAGPPGPASFAGRPPNRQPQVLQLCRASRVRSPQREGGHPGSREREGEGEGGESDRQGGALRDRARRERRRQTRERAEKRRRRQADGRLGAGLARGEGEAAGHDRAGANPDEGEAGGTQREPALRRD